MDPERKIFGWKRQLIYKTRTSSFAFFLLEFRVLPYFLNAKIKRCVGSSYAQQTTWGQCEILSYCSDLIEIITKPHIYRRRHELGRSHDMCSRICMHILEVSLPNPHILKFDKLTSSYLVHVRFLQSRGEIWKAS
jgi:hypothetical protein